MSETKDEGLIVANTIAQQIGARAFFMMGSRNRVGGKNYLVFDIRGSQRANRVKVILDPSDTYTVEFWKMRCGSPWLEASRSGVYADMLIPIIEKETGLCLSV